MKNLKIYLFIFIAFFLTGISSVAAVEVTGSATVNVILPPTVSISANPTTVSAGSNSTISYSSTGNVSYCTLSHNGINNTGGTPKSVTEAINATTTYSVYCVGAGGTSPTASVTINVPVPVKYTVSTNAGPNGSISPTSASVNANSTTAFTISPNSGYVIDTTSGCGGTLSGSTYTTAAITSNCTVNAAFKIGTCSGTTTQTVTVSCDSRDGFDLVSGSVTRRQTKVYPSCTFGSPVTTSNSTYVSDSCVYVASGCSTPTTQNVTTSCDLNANGDAATSGSVTRRQTKVYPSCTFGSPVTTSNSTYVSDTCVYPPSSCSSPLTQNVTVSCDSIDGKDLVSGSVTRRQTKVYPSCTFGSPVTTSNSTYVSDSCVYTDSATVPTVPVVPPGPTPVDGYWSGNWVYDMSSCPATATMTMYCVYDDPANKGNMCINGDTGMPADSWTKDYTTSSCPTLDSMSVTYKGEDVRSLTNTYKKVPYNGIVKVTWKSSSANSCSCTASDAKGSTSCGSSLNPATPYLSPGLKRNTTYTVVCNGDYGSSVSRTITSPVDIIRTDVKEQ